MTISPSPGLARLSRLTDWRLRFDALITERLRAPFAWGSNDCALFAADNVLALTGVDPAFGLRSHASARQAARSLRQHGGLAALVDLHLGSSCNAAQAVQGDVVMVPMNTESGGRLALGVCLSAEFAAGPGAFGLLQTSMANAVCAWRVG